MKIYIVQATAQHEEVSGISSFIHKRAWTDKTRAKEFAPLFAKEIENDKTRIFTYCNVNTKVSGIELIQE